jgi:hypothetical protein
MDEDFSGVKLIGEAYIWTCKISFKRSWALYICFREPQSKDYRAQYADLIDLWSNTHMLLISNFIVACLLETGIV